MKTKYTLRAIGIQLIAILLTSFSTAQNSASADLHLSSVSGDVTDIVSNAYPTVRIGSQCWMQYNLNVSTYLNGDPIPQVQDPNEWEKLTTGAWCYYNNDPANGSIYGKLYNWFALNDPRGLAPSGWKIPSYTDWTTLITFLGGESVAGGKMKATTGWNSPNTGATNSSGFTALPGGFRLFAIYDYQAIGYNGSYWSSTENSATGFNAFSLELGNETSIAYFGGPQFNGGGSVRCVKDDCTSWIGIYNDNPNIIPNQEKIWDNSNGENSLPIKICADGSKATIIKFKNSELININDIRFRVKSNYGNYNPALNGDFNTSDYTIIGDTVFAKFTHPQYLSGGTAINRPDAFEVFDYSNGNTLHTISTEIYRAPVLMVHGLWANRSSFGTLDNALCSSIYPPMPALTWRADYGAKNSYGFNDNDDVVPKNINILLTIARTRNYSAGKVIVVAHSMGGILTRYYQQSAYRDDIQKIITINTPHSGTQIANFLTSNPKAEYIKLALGWIGYNCYNGAIDNLKVDSPSISILNGASLHNHDIPSHAISTDTFWPIECGWPSYFISVLAPFTSLSTVKLINQLYDSESNDLIVPLSSQKGSFYSDSPINDQCHMGSTDNPNVISTVKDLIQRNPSDAAYFLQNGFEPPTLSSNLKMAQPTINSKNSTSGTVTIAPLSSTYHPGDIIPISVSSTGTINHLNVSAGDPSGNINYLDELSDNAIYNYNVPLDIMGKLKIMAIGFDSAGFVALDTIQTNVVLNNVALDSIELYGNAIYVEVNKTASVSTIAYFNNGYDYNESMLSDIQYQISDTKYANYVGSNLIKGKEVGLTILSVTYLNQTKNISVVVIPENNTLGTMTINPDDNVSNSEKLKVNIYPNPTNGIFTIEIQASNSDSLSLKICDLTGKKVYETKYLKDETKHEVDIRGNAAGIYIVTIKDEKNNIVARKIVKM